MNSRNTLNLEYIFACSPSMLHKFLTTAEGLKSWFCDDVLIEKERYTFNWERETEKAILSEDHVKSNVQFEWTERKAPESTLFEIIRSPITRETILKVATTCDDSLQEEEEIYWNNIINDLKGATGG